MGIEKEKRYKVILRREYKESIRRREYKEKR